MKHYELLFVLKPTLTEEELKAKFDFIKGVMEKNDAEISYVNEMGVRKLAYEIEKCERGYYFVIYYKANPSIIDEILRNLRLTEEVLRFLNLKYENKKEIACWSKLSTPKAKKEDKKEPPAPNKEATQESK